MDHCRIATVHGVIVRANDYDMYPYLVLWSREYNHSFIFRDDIDDHIWTQSRIGHWLQYDVILDDIRSAPENIETRATNLRQPTYNFFQLNLPFGNSEIFQQEGSSLTMEDIYDLRDAPTLGIFKIVQSVRPNAYIKHLKLSMQSWEQCFRADYPFIQAISRLVNIAKKDEKYPWIIKSFRPIENHSENLAEDEYEYEEPINVSHNVHLPADREIQRNSPSTVKISPPSAEIIPQIAPKAEIKPLDLMKVSTSIYFNSTQQKLNETQRRHHLAALQKNVIQPGSTITGLNSIVPDAKPLEALDKEVSMKTKLMSPTIIALVVTEQMVRNNTPVWVMYSREHTSEKTPYIRICKSVFNFKIGAWYEVSLSIPETRSVLGAQVMSHDNVVDIKSHPNPDTIIVDYTYTEIPNQIGKIQTAFIMCRVEKYIYMNMPRLENRFIGIIYFPEFSHKFIDFSLMKECIVEAVPGKYGWEVVRFHGVDPDLPKHNFPSTLQSYLLTCQKNNIQPNTEKADIVSPDCFGQIWLRNNTTSNYQDIDRLSSSIYKSDPFLFGKSVELMAPAKPLYQPDLENNSNDSVWDNMEDEEADGTDSYDFVGVIIRINKGGVVLYIPYRFVQRVFCPAKLMKFTPSLGDWVKTVAQKRRPREQDEEKPPLFSHIAINNLKRMNILRFYPHWCQRNHGGVFEFLLRAGVSISSNLLRVANSPFYIIDSEGVQVLIPIYRMDAILNQNNSEIRSFEFWATLTAYDAETGISLQVLDSTTIDEVLPDGTVVSLGYGKLMPVDDENNEIAENDLVEDKNSEEVPSTVEEEFSTLKLLTNLAVLDKDPIQTVIKKEALQDDYKTVTDGIRLLRNMEESC